MPLILSFLGFLLSFAVCADEAKDLAVIEELLKTNQGVEGMVHAAAVDQNLFVFSYMGETGFFEQIRLSLVPKNKTAFEALKTLKRHDKIRLFGKLEMNNKQAHIEVTEVQLLKVWSNPYPDYTHEVRLPKDLEGTDSFIGKVHAVHGDGAVVVLEYKDSVLPLVVKPDQLDFTKDLFRGDKVRLFFDIALKPARPTHLELKAGVKQPVQVLDNVRLEHSVVHEFEGSLVMFSASPQIKFNVFAVQRDMGDGVTREYTLIPASFSEVEFKELRDKLQAIWDSNPEVPINNRNKWLKRSIKLRAKGLINVIDPNQANPQIFYSDIKDIQIL